MKKGITLIFLFFCILIFSQYSFKYYQIDTLAIKRYDQLKKESFYKTVNSKELLYYIKSSDHKFKLVFTFAFYCKPCKEMHPKVLTLKKDFDNLDVFYLTDLYNGKQFLSTEKYLRNIGNESPIFSLGFDDKLKLKDSKYNYLIYDSKKKKDIKVDRYDYYIQNLAPNHKDYGYALILLYNENDDLIYASTFNESSEQVLEKVIKLIKQ